MKKKPYPTHEEQPMGTGEPMVAYGSAAMPRASRHQLTPYQMEVLQRSEEDSRQDEIFLTEK